MKSITFLKTIAIFLALFAASENVQALPYERSTDIKIQTNATVTTTSTKLVNANWARNYILIQNLGTTNVLVKFGSAHSGTEGITIFPSGNYEPFLVPVGDIYMRSSTSTDDVVIIEGEKL